MRRLREIARFALLIPISIATATLTSEAGGFDQAADDFVTLAWGSHDEREPVYRRLSDEWHDSYNAMAIEALRVKLDHRIVHLVRKHNKGARVKDWYSGLEWLWSLPDTTAPEHANFKARLYSPLDTKFARYFRPEYERTIRLDEIVWGGVVQDGIPPLRNPKMLEAKDANYLGKSDDVFGIEINGDARAYPKRILAWHEMFVDTVGGVPIAGVYCTLCGSVIIYETRLDGVDYKLGTSGFLYQSNKLMYDRATHSLWSTLEGEPVVGPLVGKGIRLKTHPVVSTRWKDWEQRHPDSLVLSLNTGYKRDYREGVAYQDYFSHDSLMFPVPEEDRSLSNKAEVLAIRLSESATPLAISETFLRKNRVFNYENAGVRFVVITDRSGANRVFENPNGIEFESSKKVDTLVDASGLTWTWDEASLVSSNGTKLKRLSAHRAFWFGWRAAFPDTELIK